MTNLTKRQINQMDKRIEKVYYQRCSGVQINIMDIQKVFKHGREVLIKVPTMNDIDLGDHIATFVETIRLN